MQNISLFLTDIDGVWTDGGMYYGPGGEYRKFNTSDSAGVMFLRLAGIRLAVISGEDCEMTRRRCRKLGIEECHIGVSDKLALARQILQKYDLTWEQVAYIGDDLNDILLLRKVGLSACPSSAEVYVRNEVDWVLDRRGGEGAFREFVQRYLSQIGMLDRIIQAYVDRKLTEE